MAKKKKTVFNRIKHELFHVQERAQLLMFMGVFAIFGVVFLGVSSAAANVPVEVRAKGTTGQERIELRIKDKTVASWQVGTSYQTYSYGHGVSIANNEIKVHFVNNGVSNGKDMNADIDYIKVNGETFQSEASNVYSSGSWQRSTGCRAGNKSSETLHCNGYFQYPTGDAGTIKQVPPSEGSVEIQVRLQGTTGQEKIELKIADKTVKTWNATTSMATTTYTHGSTVYDRDIKIAYTNDGKVGNVDKNVRIDYIKVNGKTFQTEAGNVYSQGSWRRSDSCAPGNKSSEWIHCNGFVQYSIGDAGTVINPEEPDPTPEPVPEPPVDPEPTPEPTPEPEPEPSATAIVVRAKGVTGEEKIDLQINKKKVKTLSLGTSYSNYSYTHSGSLGEKDIRLDYNTDGKASNGTDKNIQIDYIKVNNDTYQTEAGNVYSTGTWTRSNGCAPGNKSSEWIHCNGYIEYTIKPVGSIDPTPTPEPTPPENPTTILTDDGYIDINVDGAVGVNAPITQTLNANSGLQYRVTQNGRTIENTRVNGCLDIQANNVTIRNVEVICQAVRGYRENMAAIDIRDTASGTVIEHSTIICPGDRADSSQSHCMAGILGHNLEARYNDISRTIDGIVVTGSNVVFSYNYVHDLHKGYDPFQWDKESHNDGIQTYGGNNHVFTGNHLEGFDQLLSNQQAIFIQPETLNRGGNAYNVTVTNNYVAKTWGSALKCRENPYNNYTVKCQMHNNVIDKRQFAYGNAINVEVANPNNVGLSCNKWSSGGYVTSDFIKNKTNSTSNCPWTN